MELKVEGTRPVGRPKKTWSKVEYMIWQRIENNESKQLKVTKVDWLENLMTFFVICFCSPFPY